MRGRERARKGGKARFRAKVVRPRSREQVLAHDKREVAARFPEGVPFARGQPVVSFRKPLVPTTQGGAAASSKSSGLASVERPNVVGDSVNLLGQVIVLGESLGSGHCSDGARDEGAEHCPE